MKVKTENNRENAIPKGVTDFLPEQAEKIGFIEEKINRTFELWGFRRIIAPMLEFEELLAIGMDDSLRDKSFRFEDRQSHRLLAIPPDITPQVARIEAMRMSGYPLPHRLYYNGRVLRQVESQSGRSRELYQSGVELIGLDSPEADAEMIAITAEILRKLGFDSFKIDLGQVEFFRGIMGSATLAQPVIDALQEAIARKDSTTVRTILEGENIPDAIKAEIAALPRMFGSTDVIQKASSTVRNDRSRRALDNLAKVIEILAIHGIRDELTIDLGEIRGLSYHTGVTFEGFVPAIGEPVCGGGRYDGLMGRYGRSVPATGFAFNVLNLLHGVEKTSCMKTPETPRILLFNKKEDRRAALELTSRLREKGCIVARDIIRRDLHDSIEYARRTGIQFVIIVGESGVAVEEAVLIRVSDGVRRTLTMDEFTDFDHSALFS
ncbi:MAG TPA: ATP phosphoribosyltransferase regulatory subunit [Geobacteraceae bacterium]|nr:ATP phosphoribosyltransferase regulatory subunit [Geobacteraceae bacterium]